MLTLHAYIVKSYLSQFLFHFHIDQTFQFLLGGMCCILREEGSYFDLLTMGDLYSLYNIVTLGGFAHLLLSRCVAVSRFADRDAAPGLSSRRWGSVGLLWQI